MAFGTDDTHRASLSTGWGFGRRVVAVLLASAAISPSRVPAALPEGYVPYVTVQLDVPGEPGNRRLAQMGYVDVTAEPFGADATGRRDATAAIQRAILFARDHQMVTFFPPGEYRLTDTLTCIHGRHDPKTHKKRLGGRLWPCVLVGSRRAGRRPVLALAANAPGFGDPNRPKYVVHFWARAVDEGGYDDPQPNINMDQMLVGLDVRIGAGNAGAVGVRHRAAQGSGVQDCRIDATGALCGLEGGAGSGGSHAAVTVVGGRIGADLRGTQPAATITGFTLTGQTGPALLVAGRQAVAAVGLRIRANHAGPILRTRTSWGPHHGQLCLVDSSIEFDSPHDAPAIQAASSLTLHDVYVRNAAQILRGPGPHRLDGQPTGWTHVEEFALSVTSRPLSPKVSKERLRYPMPIYVDGRRIDQAALGRAAASQAPPADLQSRHLWGEDFPTFESPGCANVRAAPYAARGDGKTDDTAALQRAIDDSEIVFVPKGIYLVSKTLRLRARTKLIGVHRSFSVLLASVAPGGDFADADHPHPLVDTANDADAETVLAFLKLAVTYETPGAYCLRWRCGRKSIFRAVDTVLPGWWWPRRAPKQPVNHPLVVVCAHGGGQWYNFNQGCRRWLGPDYRHLLIRGTREPLAIYQCNPEYARGDAEMEIRDAKFVSIYGLKSEYNAPVLRVRNSEHVRVFGYGGNAAAWGGRSLFVIERTGNFLLANLVDSPRLAGKGKPDEAPGVGVDPRTWHMVIERTANGPEIRTKPLERPVLYRRGRPRARPGEAKAQKERN